MTVLHEKEMMRLFFCLSSSLVIILFYDDAQPHLARMTLHKLTDLGLETLPHTPYFPDLFLIDYYEHFFTLKKNLFNEVETARTDFLASNPLEFYCICLINLVNRRLKFIHVQGSYFDCLKYLLLQFIN